MSNIIDSIQVSGVTYTIQGSGGGGNPTVELTQAEYNALVESGAVQTNTYYIITDAQAGDLTQYWTSAQTSSAITAAVSGKASQSDLETVSGQVANKQDTLISGTNIKTINNESILGSGNIDIQGGGSSYTAGDGIDITNDVISVTGKQDTLSAGTGISIVDNVISATGGGGGGGKAVSGGTNISITTGETADTINCTLPIREGSNSSGKGIIVGDSECTATGLYGISLGHNSDANGQYSFCNGSNSNASGQMSFAHGNGCDANHDYTFMFGLNNDSTKSYQFSYGTNLHPTNQFEFGFGTYNNSSSASTTFGHSGNTMFSIGNGYDFSSTHNWHNAFEVRQNGDIYVPNTDDTSVTGDKAYSLYPMVRLQDTITATAANTTALGGKVDTSAITTSISSSSTDSQVPSAKAVYDQLGGLKLVKLTQSAYDALSPNYDSNTLYVIVN